MWHSIKEGLSCFCITKKFIFSSHFQNLISPKQFTLCYKKENKVVLAVPLLNFWPGVFGLYKHTTLGWKMEEGAELLLALATLIYSIKCLRFILWPLPARLLAEACPASLIRYEFPPWGGQDAGSGGKWSV